MSWYTFLYDTKIVVVESRDPLEALENARARDGEPETIHCVADEPRIYEMRPEAYLHWSGNWFYDSIVIQPLVGRAVTLTRLH